jgi:hypothetical protein
MSRKRKSMPKFFDNFPEEFEQYNPEDESFGLSEYSTHDEYGELHSYDDKPALVYSEEGTTYLSWHSHGRLERENDKPTSIRYGENSYNSSNPNSPSSSFNGKPSSITYNPSDDIFSLSYYDYDGLHRENGLPARLVLNHTGILETRFYEKNELHRGNDLPAYVKGQIQGWYIKGCRHRENGPAVVDKTSKRFNKDLWFLFDLNFTERQFNLIKNFQMEKDSPLWLAFLHGVEIVSESEADIFLKNNLHNELPLKWGLLSLGVTDEVFKHALIKRRNTPARIFELEKTSQFVLQVTEFINQERRL